MDPRGSQDTNLFNKEHIVRKTFLPYIVVAALGLVAVFGVFGYRAVYAQAVAPTATATTAAPATAPTTAAPAQSGQTTQAVPGKRGGLKGEASNTDLAAALGITTDKLTAAYTSANAAALKQAVAKGLITQAQADQITANAQNNGEPFHMFGNLANSGIDYNALLAQALGITTDQLKTAQTTAYNTALDTAVKNGTMTQAQADLAKARRALQNDTKFQANLKSAYDAAVKQAVTDGTITQAQADAIIQAETQQPNGGFDGFGPGFGGGRGGHGGPRGFLPPSGTTTNNGTSSNNQAAPQATPNNSGL